MLGLFGVFILFGFVCLILCLVWFGCFVLDLRVVVVDWFSGVVVKEWFPGYGFG